MAFKLPWSVSIKPKAFVSLQVVASEMRAASLMVVLHGTVTWSHPSPGHASAGHVLVSPEWPGAQKAANVMVASNPTVCDPA
jgi:hypothetical protein